MNKVANAASRTAATFAVIGSDHKPMLVSVAWPPLRLNSTTGRRRCSRAVVAGVGPRYRAWRPIFGVDRPGRSVAAHCAGCRRFPRKPIVVPTCRGVKIRTVTGGRWGPSEHERGVECRRLTSIGVTPDCRQSRPFRRPEAAGHSLALAEGGRAWPSRRRRMSRWSCRRRPIPVTAELRMRPADRRAASLAGRAMPAAERRAAAFQVTDPFRSRDR